MPQGRARLIHDGTHACDTLAETHENRLAHEVMTDIELDDRGNRDDGRDVIIVDPVARVDLEPCLGAPPSPLHKTRKLAAERRRVAFHCSSAVGSGVELDLIVTDFARRIDLLGVRVDKQRNLDAGLSELGDKWRKRLNL